MPCLGDSNLSGPEFEPIIEETIESMKEMKAEDFRAHALHRLEGRPSMEEAFPDALSSTASGSTITLSSYV